MFRIIIVSLSIGFAYLNFIVYKSYVLQTSVVVDFNTRDYKKENFVRLENSNISFPSLSGTAFPMYALLANYKILKDSLSADQFITHQSDIPRVIENIFAGR